MTEVNDKAAVKEKILSKIAADEEKVARMISLWDTMEAAFDARKFDKFTRSIMSYEHLTDDGFDFSFENAGYTFFFTFVEGGFMVQDENFYAVLYPKRLVALKDRVKIFKGDFSYVDTLMEKFKV